MCTNFIIIIISIIIIIIIICLGHVFAILAYLSIICIVIIPSIQRSRNISVSLVTTLLAR